MMHLMCGACWFVMYRMNVRNRIATPALCTEYLVMPAARDVNRFLDDLRLRMLK